MLYRITSPKKNDHKIIFVLTFLISDRFTLIVTLIFIVQNIFNRMGLMIPVFIIHYSPSPSVGF